MKLIIENWPEISGALAAIYGAAWVIAKKTKTKKDDEILTKIGKVFDLIFPKTRPKSEKKD